MLKLKQIIGRVQWNRHTFALLLGAAVALVPDMTDLAAAAQGTGWKPLLVVARVVGYLLTAIAVASKAYARVAPVLDKLEAATVQPTSTPTPVTRPETPRAKDAGRVSAQVLGSLAFAAVLAVLSLFCMCGPAHAEDAGRWSYGPSAAAAVAAIDLRTGDYLAGAQAVALGPCFGVTFVPWALGGDLCANVQVGKAEPNRYGGSIMGHWRRYFDGGLGAFFVQGDGWRFLALIGARAPFLQGGGGK